ncbi:MAG: hypothetical protein ACTSW1_16320 [Candidatus Hodarchaeales archaeon]
MKKIPVPITFQEFSKFNYSEQREFFLEYFSEKTIEIFFTELQHSGAVPFFSRATLRRGYSLTKIALEVFDFQIPEEETSVKDIDETTGVKLTNPSRVLYEWNTALPFKSGLPEIEFIPDGENMPSGSFTWKVRVPDAIDLYYLPLLKKETKTIQLVFQPVNVSVE